MDDKKAKAKVEEEESKDRMSEWMNEELLNRNKNINRGYRKLEVWKEAIELFIIVRKKVKEMTGLSFKVRAQIEDSILSVSSNIHPVK